MLLTSPARLRWALWLPTLLLAAGPMRAAAPALEPPSAEALERGRALVAAMQQGERGPYARIAWFCNDGTVHPPRPYPCGDRGGGRQHAVYSSEREELARLGWPVGTVFAALPWEDFWDEANRHARLRVLPFERYLVETEEGWVLRRARFYRGRVQIEDEEAAGRELLLQLLARQDWLRDEFLLVREIVRTVPHHGGEDRTRAIRRTSQEIAERDPSFERLRIKLHTAPGADDLPATRQWIDAARRRGVAEAILAQAGELERDLQAQYSAEGRRERLQAARQTLSKGADPAIADLLDRVWERPAAERVNRYARVLRHVRERAEGGAPPARILELIDLSLDIEAELIPTSFEALAGEGITRRDLVATARSLVDALYGTGFVSAGERSALERPLAAVAPVSHLPSDAWLELTDALEKAGGWSLGTIRYAFAEPLVRWVALEPAAARFVDELLRGSPMLALAEISHRLTLDAESVAGRSHRLFGAQRAGLLGLNPGVAVGTLRLHDGESAPNVQRDEIVVLPETVSDLTPVAGILTLADGNLLSHVQLLARNLGIPNATVPPGLRRDLESRNGRQVLLAVARDGSVVLEDADALPVDLLGPSSGPSEEPEPVDAPAPDLSVRGPLALSDLHAGLAGKVVGPKAANLGELARRFPGRVAPAIALPFGVFAEHIRAGDDPPKRRLDRAFARHRSGELDDEGLAQEIEAVRAAVTALHVSDPLERKLAPMLEREFGSPGSYGVFVRSDTNVEDLPGFTGAGLNLTVPNVVGIDRVLGTIPRVWASPFTRRAMAWRERLLTRPEEVYTSVLLMRTVAADKSGVLVTADLTRQGVGLTVATAWGVGGAVDGEAAETVVLRSDGSMHLVREAKAPFRRRPAAGGGLEWVPASPGRVLTDAEARQLRALAAEVVRVMESATGPDGMPLPWDVEFGFVDGELTLFQIRPLVERGTVRADRVVTRLAPRARARPVSVALDRPPEAAGAPAGAEGVVRP